MPNTTRRAVLGAMTATPVLLAAGRALAADPGAEMFAMMAEYNDLFLADMAGDDRESLSRRFALLASIAAYSPRSLNGALAKLRLGFDEDEIEAQLGFAAPLDAVGFTALRDLFRITGTA